MKLLRARTLARWLAAAGFCLAGHVQPLFAAAQQNVLQLPGINVRTESTPITIILILTLLPAILLSMTPFVRILIIFHFLRQALGTQTAPTNQTLIGLSLFLTYFLMQPVAVNIQQQALGPLENGSISTMEAV